MSDDASESITLSVTPENLRPQRVDTWLAQEFPEFSRSKIQRLIREGAISRADQKPIDLKKSVAPGDVFCIEEPPAEPVDLVPQNIPLPIVFEDDALLVINKPAGLVVHPAAGHPDGTLVNAVLYHCPGVFHIGGEQRPGIVHRLDRDTSGLIVVAKCDAAYAGLVEAFQTHRIEKTYFAVTCGVPEPAEGHLETLLARSPYDRKKMAVVQQHGKIAITDYAVEKDFLTHAFLRVRILTGRTHQIRVHLSHIGCPIAGDRVYGSAKADSCLPRRPDRQLLHAGQLRFPHPLTKQELSFSAPIPEDFFLSEALRCRAACCP